MRLPPPSAVQIAMQSNDVSVETHVLVVTQYLASAQQGWVSCTADVGIRKKLSASELRRLQKLGAYGVEVAWVPKGRSLGRIVGGPVRFNICELLDCYRTETTKSVPLGLAMSELLNG